MSLFPTNARTGQTHKKFGRKYSYSETTKTWTPIVPLASVAEVRKAEVTSASATQFYTLATDLPLTGNTTGSMAFVQETNRLYVWSGTGWYNIATISAAAASISGANSSYTLATDGTPTVITLSQTGLTSPTWSYTVTSGSLGRTATVTQADNVFTITPSTSARNIGSFGITFKATDGSNTLVTTSQFTMSNTAPVIGTGPSATYTLASDGTPTVITLAATDADGHSITWSYEVVSGSLGGTTVSISGSEFTITPSTNTNDAGTFQLRFIASDGASFDAEVSEFSLAFGPNWAATTLIHTLINPNAYGTTANDQFGSSVAISGNYAVVSAEYEDIKIGTTVNTESGRIYVFDVTSGSLLHTLNNPNAYSTPANDHFGYSIDIDNNTIIAGVPYEADSSGTNAGKAYIFDAATGTLLYTLNNPNTRLTGTGDHFGYSVGISGNYAIVGARGEDDATGIDSGKAYIFDVTTGSLVHTLNNPNAYSTPANDYFGISVSISGNYAIVGASEEDGGGSASGKAYIFDVTTGSLVHTLSNPNASTNDYFGRSVSISGNYAIVAAAWEDTTGLQSGIAYIFDVTTGTLLYTLNNPNAYSTSANDYFGVSVSISGNYAIVGAADEDDAGGLDSGKAYIFDVTTGTLAYTLNNANGYGTSSSDYFGYSVAIHNNTVIVGAYGEDSATYSTSGNAYIFQAG